MSEELVRGPDTHLFANKSVAQPKPLKDLQLDLQLLFLSFDKDSN